MFTTGDAAPAGAFEIRKSTEKTSCVALFENVREIEMQEGRKGWQWDEYTIPVTYRAELEDRIRKDTASWLSTAKEYEKKTLATQIREKRNELLAKCDFAVLQDAPTDKEVWSAYRQALRDVPEQPGFPYTIEWPKWPGNAEGKEK